MDSRDFSFIVDIIKKNSGISLGDDKLYLLESRLLPVARSHGMSDLKALANSLRQGGSQALIDEVVEAMTTNESMFFRDKQPFEIFKNLVLPRMIEKKRDKRLRIWSAACSNGQEAYSVAMILEEEAAKLPGWNIEILGTDLSGQVVNKAKEGIYSQFEVQRGLPIQMLVKYFDQREDNTWQIKETLRKKVSFKEHNLLKPCAHFGKFDIIFCRNVLIYFDADTKKEVLNHLAGAMTEHGILYLGSTETIIGVSDRFKAIDGQRGLFELPQAVSSAARVASS